MATSHLLSGGDWKEVVNRKKRYQSGIMGKTDIASKVKWSNQRNFSSFFFSDFPETHGAKEMLQAFSYYGEAMEVVIPPKRDKMGRRFGFVRFSNVRDARVLAVKLDNIIIGANKIHVNIPRFNRDWSDCNHVDRGVQSGLGPQKRIKAVWRRKKVGSSDGGKKLKGHANVARNIQPHLSSAAPRIVYHRKNNISELCYNVSEDEMKRYEKMYIGVVKTPGSTYSAQEWFSRQGVFSIKVTLMGANKVLLEEMEEGLIVAVVSEPGDWTHEKFAEIRKWSPAETDNERVAWVRCHGVPIHAWNEEFFASLARKFGDYLGTDDATRKGVSMDVARIKIRSRVYDVFNMVVVDESPSHDVCHC